MVHLSTDQIPSGRHEILAGYIDAAMVRAHSEIIEDEGSFWSEIPGVRGVWARHVTLEGCRRELREALSDWIALCLRLGLDIPGWGHVLEFSSDTEARAGFAE